MMTSLPRCAAEREGCANCHIEHLINGQDYEMDGLALEAIH